MSIDKLRTALLRYTNTQELEPRNSHLVLLLILLLAGLCATLHAMAKPFWYDEVCTVIVSRLPAAADVWQALSHAADTNPPGFYLVTRLTRSLVPDDHLGYRLPSILGLLGTIGFLYFILSRRVNRLSALVGATLVLCTPLASFAYEARPYTLLLACISGAILAWQRMEDSRLYSVALALSLAAAVSLHYYAVFVWPAFLIAETAVCVFRRRFRLGAWAAILAGALPLLLFAQIMVNLRQYYGQNFWAKPSIEKALHAHDWLFGLGSHWGSLLALAITALLLYYGIARSAPMAGPAQPRTAAEALPVEERVLILVLLWVPLIAFAAAKISHGGMTDRYMLPTVLGGALALGYLIDKIPAPGRLLVLLLFLLGYTSSSVGVARDWVKGSLLAARTAATREVQGLGNQLQGSTLPIVISDELRYLPMAYYTPADSSRKLYAIADPQAALVSTQLKSDSLDLALLALRQYFPVQVEDYAGFVSRHPEFFLVLGGGDMFDWWPARLVRDGHTLQLVSATGGTRLFKVTVRP